MEKLPLVAPNKSISQRNKAAQSLNRSCEGCRARKIRCQPSEGSQAGKCARCERAKLSCVYLAPQQKRRRKRTDVRVAELEKEISSLRHRFEGREELRGHQVSPKRTLEAQDDLQIVNPIARYSGKKHEGVPPVPTAKENDDDDTDEVEVDDATADLLFTKFKMDLAPHFPFLHFPDEMSAKALQESRPILFNAILATSAASLHSPLGDALFHKGERLYSYHVFMEGTKSLELVQALILTALWYQPPDHFSNLKFTTYAHVAGNMALDMRLGRRRSGAPRPVGSGLDESHDEIDGQRTLLACYVVCSTMSFSLRRPQMFAFSSSVGKCLDQIEDSDVSSDRHISAWVRLQHIAEEAAMALRYSDSDGATLKDIKTQSMLKVYDRQLDLWKIDYWEKTSLSLKVHFFYIRCSLHEISLYTEYPYEDFEPPYLMRPVPLYSEERIELSPAYVTSVITCVESAKAILDIFVTLDTISIRSVYVIFLARVVYALVILTKIMLCTRSPNSGVGKIVEASSIRLTEYMQRIMTMLHTAAGKQAFQKSATFLAVVTKLAFWYHRHISRSGESTIDDLLEPLKELKTSGQDVSDAKVAEALTAAGRDWDRQSSSQTSSYGRDCGIASPNSLVADQGPDPPVANTVPESNIMNQNNAILPDIPWFSDHSLNFQTVGGSGGLMTGFTDFDQFWNAPFLDDSPMLMFEGHGNRYQQPNINHLS